MLNVQCGCVYVCWSWSTKLTCLLNAAMSSLKDSDEHTSAPCAPGSLGVHVASSHFSKTNASRGNNGCLCVDDKKKQILK